MRRPLKDKRPIGPFIEASLDKSDEVESEEEFATSDTPEDVDEDVTDNPLLQQAESWWEGISSEENKRKMMKEYMSSMTDKDRSEIEDMLDEAGL